ncbi:hypothetical protein GCM10022235_63370 [Kribbella ginsengisoli]|uniref:Uncharacterized protein n=1 Tax=Kribbella ginsengisoli TaxID=363865 RepID=A0ABP6YI58_9ACTN
MMAGRRQSATRKTLAAIKELRRAVTAPVVTATTSLPRPASHCHAPHLIDTTRLTATTGAPSHCHAPHLIDTTRLTAMPRLTATTGAPSHCHAPHLTDTTHGPCHGPRSLSRSTVHAPVTVHLAGSTD